MAITPDNSTPFTYPLVEQNIESKMLVHFSYVSVNCEHYSQDHSLFVLFFLIFLKLLKYMFVLVATTVIVVLVVYVLSFLTQDILYLKRFFFRVCVYRSFT